MKITFSRRITQLEPEPSYYSEDGANELSRIFADKINKKREGRGYAPLRVCGQLDSLLALSLETMTNVQSEGEIDTWNEITLDKLKTLDFPQTVNL